MLNHKLGINTFLAVCSSLVTWFGYLTQSANAQSSNSSTATIIEISPDNGPVQLKEAGTEFYRPAAVGTNLSTGDLVFSDSGTRVTLSCDNGIRRTMPSGTVTGVNSICPYSHSSRTTSGSSRQQQASWWEELFGRRRSVGGSR